LGILIYSCGIKCFVLHCFAMQCSVQECKPNVNTLRTGDADLRLYAYKQFKYPVPNVLTGDLLYVFKSVFIIMNVCGNIESTRSFSI
jgi:hypothetical protein